MRPESISATQIRPMATALLVVAAIIVWAYPFATIVPYDYWHALLPWWRQIVATGRIRAFATPIGNYTPPYLYLLSATTLLDDLLPPLIALKLLSTAGAAWLVFALYRLLRACGARHPAEGAVVSLILPTLIINVPVLAQADTFWLAPCVLAVSASIRRKALAMVLYASLAFAVKAQAIFLAPFVLSALLANRAPWWLWLLPIPVYCAAMLPAWLAGWPASDLLTVYVRQTQWHYASGLTFVSDAANPWAALRFLDYAFAIRIFWAGYAAAALAAALFVWRFSKPMRTPQALAAATLSAAIIPFFLPGMHERFFALAEILSFALAWTRPKRRTVFAAIGLQFSLIAAFAGWKLGMPLLSSFAWLFSGAAMLLLAGSGNAPEHDVCEVIVDTRLTDIHAEAVG
jgi:Gpi18-like mannosyltransferase